MICNIAHIMQFVLTFVNTKSYHKNNLSDFILMENNYFIQNNISANLTNVS